MRPFLYIIALRTGLLFLPLMAIDYIIQQLFLSFALVAYMADTDLASYHLSGHIRLKLMASLLITHTLVIRYNDFE